MTDGIYFSITVVKNGQQFTFKSQNIGGLTPVLLDAIVKSGVYGPDVVDNHLNKLGGEDHE